jgi:aminobenzoyl-glutamate utilization protein A
MDLNSYVYDRAMEAVSGAAAMYGVEMSMASMGAAVDALSDKSLVDLVGEKALLVEGITTLAPEVSLGGSEDVSWMMRAVQKRGGKAVYFVLGTDIAAGHHNEYFDLDESVLDYGPVLFAELAVTLSVREITGEGRS